MEDIKSIMAMSIVSCIFVLASYGFIMAIFYKFSKLDEVIADIRKSNADKYEFVCIKENEQDHTKWFKNGSSYKNIDGRVRDEHGVTWDFNLYKVSENLYGFHGYIFERRKINERD